MVIEFSLGCDVGHRPLGRPVCPAIVATCGTGEPASMRTRMRMIDETILAGHDLVRVFGDGDSQTTAVDRVSLELARGQFALLMGPSGSGKSTLLAMLSGLLRPTSGKVLSRDDDEMIDIWATTDRVRERYRLKHCGY